jgi:hypothetical protein
MRGIEARLSRIVLSALFVIALAGPALAQFRASVQGTVQDTSGAGVPAATVTVTSEETGKAQTVTTSEDGIYRVSNLAPGRYTVSAEAAGFRRQVATGVQVNAETPQQVDLLLEVGGIDEVVTVTADATALQTETASVGKSITTDEVLRLPQVGRDPYELVRLTPGILGDGARSGSGNSVGLPNTTGPGGSNSSIFQTENQVPVSANGQRLSANNFTIDGVSVNSLQWGGAAVVTPNQESVKEIRVLSSTYSAEDGRNSGAQIKVVTQNGTNEFHGSAIFKYNSPGLNAFNKYGGPNDAPRTRVNNAFRQYGGSLGGPIVRDKLFFFFSYEGLTNRTNDTADRWIETSEYRSLVQQIRPNGVTAQVFGAAGIEPRVIATLPTDCAVFGFDPARCRQLPGGLDIGSPTGALNQYVSLGNPVGGGLDGIPDIIFARLAVPGESRGNQFNGRFDYTPSERHQIAGSFYFTKLSNRIADAAGSSRPIGDLRFRPLNSAATASWLYTLSPTVLNELRWNFTRFSADQVADSIDTNFGIPRIEVEGLPFDRIRFGAPRAETTPAIFAQNTFELRDTVTLARGNQTWRIGGELRWEQDNNNLVGGARPIYSFVGLFNLANDTPIFEAINLDPSTGAPADAQRNFRSRDFAAFFQNDWQVNPHLTVNLGLRYEYFSPLSETEDRITNLLFPGAGDLATSRVEQVDQLFEGDKNNFGPRIGFAYNPAWLDERMVVRGGFGIAYNRIPNVVFSNTRGNPPFFSRYNICCGTAEGDFGSPFVGGQIIYALGSDASPLSYPVNPLLGSGIDPVTGGPLVGSAEIYGTEPQLPNSYVYLYSLDTEFDLGYDFVATAGYQGSSGHKLIRLVNQNFIYTPNPKFFAVYFPQPDVNTNFNALNLTLQRRFSHGVSFDAYYRFSKSIDTLSYEGPGAVTNQTYPQDLATERGPSDFDVTHYFTFSGLWELPIFRGRSDWVGKAFGGWQLNAILTARSGYPWTPKIRKDVRTPSGLTIGPIRPTAYFGGALDDADDQAFIREGGNFPGGGDQYFNIVDTGPPGIGRNSFRGPRYGALDLSIVKSTGLPGALGLGEAAKLDVRVNLFNAFNNLNLAPFGFFDNSVFADDPNFGVATAGLAGRVIELQARFSF